MGDPTTCSPQDMTACLEKHATLDQGIMGKLTTLTLDQKTKLTELIDKWIAKLIS